MKEKKITFENARNFSIIDTLKKSGHIAKAQTEKEAWFLSPFRSESEPSFKVSIVKNCWYDFGICEGGNVIDLIIKLNSLTAYEAIKKLENGFFSFHSPSVVIESITKIKIIKVIEIQHFALKQYLENRRIFLYDNESNLKEVHYEVNGKKYFGIGFQNRSNGFEIRSKYSKICIEKKDITLIKLVKGDKNKLKIFEGFFDYLSYINKFKSDSDFLILNSVALINRCDEILSIYDEIELYFDNDESGNLYTKSTLEKHKNAINCREFYKHFKDLNEWLINTHL